MKAFVFTKYRKHLIILLLLTLFVFSVPASSVFAEDGGGGPQICHGCP